MNKIILTFVLLALFSIVSGSFLRLEGHQTLWGTWKSAHNKQYSITEEPHRLAIFLENVETIAKLNAKNDGVKFAINKFADLTSAEFKAQYVNGGFYQPEMNAKEFLNYENTENNAFSIDWREKGAVTPVKDQGQCGSCWSFSAIGVLEGFNFINSGKLVPLSEQQLVDCADKAGYGCSGGSAYLALEYAAQYGLESEEDYPYSAKYQKCQYDASKALKINSGYKFITPKNTDQLKAALTNSPVSILIEADQSIFQFYKSGVIGAGCGANVNHAVLAVGYQTPDFLEAFIVKNSWGTSWGSNGYVYIFTAQLLNNGQGACGILSQPVVPVL